MTAYNNNFFCGNINEYTRLKTRVVHVGNVPLGGLYPIRIQSMTNTNTLDTIATVDQCIRIIEAGADYVRITAPGIPEAENLANIKKLLLQKGYRNPLIADIHFNPQAAEIAARYVEKIRINPGNYVDKRVASQTEFTEAEYQAELERIRERLLPLIKICKENKTAIRIGVNHGSLSGRIVNRYGDTPLGMAESAMEFIRIFAAEGFNELVVSMKASNTRIMVESTRLLVNYMFREDLVYPLHLGVTEAGDGEDGRIRSATGIGTLLADGIGDTIRVSLTEDPEKEIPVARALVDHFERPVVQPKVEPEPVLCFNPFDYHKRQNIAVNGIGGSYQPVVVSSLLHEDNDNQLQADYIFDPNNACTSGKRIIPAEQWNGQPDAFPLFTELKTDSQFSPVLNFLLINKQTFSQEIIPLIAQTPALVLVIEQQKGSGFLEARQVIGQLHTAGVKSPVILKRTYEGLLADQLSIQAPADMGGIFIDGLADGIWIENKTADNEQLSTSSVAFGILQATRLRMVKTEYISCPSCGRTLFDLQEVTAKVKARTSHLKGLKIAVMGCIVNGPGEMADADYGYVGAGPGKISLYKGREVVRKSIEQSEAVDALIDLIRENGDWKD
jgi:(E)-4-hydroxy-3-methylbut-2-enyl-diphosphate synthase